MMAFQDGRISILIIGPSQNGKSTFVNRLNELAIRKGKTAAEGDGSFKQTTNCDFYDIDLPVTDYKLVDIATGKDHIVPDIEDEEKILGNAWYRKQGRSKYRIQPVNRNSPTLKLRLIDTPGLDDSDGADFENMRDVLATLNDLAKSKEEWQTKIAALMLVYNANSAFSASFQKVIKDYKKCMPNLFGNLAVVNTHFSIANLSSKRQHLLRDKLLSTGGSARSRITHERGKEFAKIVGGNTVPMQFYIDNRPKNSLAFDELVSCNTVTEILRFWSLCRPMRIKQMRLVKSENMQAVDARLRTYLNNAIEHWMRKRDGIMETVTESESHRSTMLQQKQQFHNQLKRIKEDLDRLDNDDDFSLNTHKVSRNVGAAENFGRSVIRRGVKGTKYIDESGYDFFQVQTLNDSTGTWTSERFDPSTKQWIGTYEGKPGKTPSLLANTFVTNRVANHDAIEKLRKEERSARINLRENEAKFDKFFANRTTGMNKALETIVDAIETARDLAEMLSQENPPLDRSMDEASRERYKKNVDQVTRDDLLMLVKVAAPKLVDPLRKVNL